MPDLTELAALLACRARSTMLAALLEGRALPAGELTRASGVGRSTASEHLGALADAGLVTTLRSGRHCYYRLSGTGAAEALEAWFRLSPPEPPTSLRASKDAQRLTFARTCYRHLAGAVGVGVHERMLAQDWLRATTEGYDVTAAGWRGLAQLSVDVGELRRDSRAVARPCLDWTERRQHLAGPLADALCRSLLHQGWLRHGSGRGLELTSTGREGLSRTLRLDLISRAGPHSRTPRTAPRRRARP